MIYFGGFRKKSSKTSSGYEEFESLDKGEGLYNKNGSNVSLIYAAGDYIPVSQFVAKTNIRIIFGKKIKAIGASAFHSCSNLTQISFPKVTEIRGGAFYSCVNLTQAFLPNATDIGRNAFYSCRKLKKITCKQGMRSKIQQLIQESGLTQHIEIIEV